MKVPDPKEVELARPDVVLFGETLMERIQTQQESHASTSMVGPRRVLTFQEKCIDKVWQPLGTCFGTDNCRKHLFRGIFFL